MKKILVAGAGHGGLIVAANLAKIGFDVTVIEKNDKESLGYDWTDIFDINSFIEANVPISSKINFDYKEDMIFYTPSLNYFKKPIVPISEKEVKMERKQIYDILIGFALKNGVKIMYNTPVKKAICTSERVIGIKTDKQDIYADLIIDACGMNSPVRSSLPKTFGIEKKIKDSEQFYVYRAFYNKIKNTKTKEKYKVYLLPRKNKGICWVATEDDYVDVLIGRFYPINQTIVDDDLKWLRKINKIGATKIRGGQFERIPIRRPLSQIVCNGYAAIGNSAFMTVPLMGSGIAICAKSAKILTDVLIKNKDTNYEFADLWEYQVNFYKKIGYDLAYKDILKSTIINMDSEYMDTIFKNNIINDKILSDMTNGKELKLERKDIFKQGKNGILHPKILFLIGNSLINSQKISKLCKNIPTEYSIEKIELWKKEYLNIGKK